MISLDYIVGCSNLFHFGINYIMFWNVFGYFFVYDPCLVWLDYLYGMVGLGWVDHGCDLIPESSRGLLHYLVTYLKFFQLRAGD